MCTVGVVVKVNSGANPFVIRFDVIYGGGFGAQYREDQVARLALGTVAAACGSYVLSLLLVLTTTFDDTVFAIAYRPGVGDTIIVVDASRHLLGAVGVVVEVSNTQRPLAVRLSSPPGPQDSSSDEEDEGPIAYFRIEQVVRVPSPNDGQRLRCGGNILNTGSPAGSPEHHRRHLRHYK